MIIERQREGKKKSQQQSCIESILHAKNSKPNTKADEKEIL